MKTRIEPIVKHIRRFRLYVPKKYEGPIGESRPLRLNFTVSSIKKREKSRNKGTVSQMLSMNIDGGTHICPILFQKS